MKRVLLTANYRVNGVEQQAGSVIELEDERASDVIKRGRGKLDALQRVYTHIDDSSCLHVRPSEREGCLNHMPAALQRNSLKALEAADAAGGHSGHAQAARAAATARFRE